jgi:hypothetical protein
MFFYFGKTFHTRYYNAVVVVVNTEGVGLAPDQGCQMVYFQTKSQRLTKLETLGKS